MVGSRQTPLAFQDASELGDWLCGAPFVRKGTMGADIQGERGYAFDNLERLRCGGDPLWVDQWAERKFH